MRPNPTPRGSADGNTLPAVLDVHATASPDQPLVIAEDRHASVAEFADGCRRFARSLLDRGLVPGDAVGVLMPNGWRWLTAAVGAHYAGMTCVPLNTYYRHAELRSAAQRTACRVVFADRAFFGRDYAGVLEQAGLLNADPSTGFLGAAFWDRNSRSPEGADLDATDPVADPLCYPEDPALHVFTSGSSAQPKIVVLNHEDLVLNGFAIGARQHVVPGDRVWMASPLFFSYGCANALIVVLTHGLTFCVQERFDPDGSARFIAEHGCSVYYGLGEITRSLIASGAHKRHDLSSLRTGTTGFAVSDKQLAIETLGISEVCSVYGLTEGYGHSAMTDALDDVETKLHTQGRALSTQEIRAVDTDTGEVLLEQDKPRLGELQLRGSVTTGYLNDPETNARSFTDDGWFRTGDLGWLDGNGRVHFAGRLKEVVKVSGITVAPAEVENLVCNHPDVDQAWAFGWTLPDTSSESLCCAVVLRAKGDLAPDDAPEVLRSWMRERISPYKVPAAFVVLDRDGVPTTDTGKVSKRLIGESYLGAENALDAR